MHRNACRLGVTDCRVKGTFAARGPTPAEIPSAFEGDKGITHEMHHR